MSTSSIALIIIPHDYYFDSITGETAPLLADKFLYLLFLPKPMPVVKKPVEKTLHSYCVV